MRTDITRESPMSIPYCTLQFFERLFFFSLPGFNSPMADQLASSSSLPPSWRYDVFLSFRGEDTSTNFTDHLYKALVDNGINTFIDRQLTRGEEISLALLQAIEESRISLVMFSKNYASSRWCLDELVKILQCRESKKQIVLPVFYKVDPSHVRNQTSSFGVGFAKLQGKFKDNKKKVLMWRRALREVANVSGHPVKEEDYEATIINNIVKEILVRVLDRTYLNVAKHPVGLQSCVQEVKELLGVDGNGGCVVGIWGTSGIGKTTIAKAVYNAIAHKFEGSCFLSDVRETSMQHGGLIQLQNTLLSEINRGSKSKVVNTHGGKSLIENLLRQKKILLILDDVDELEQLNSLAEVEWIGEGSIMIITTKDRGLLESYGVKFIYNVRKLNDDEALELLSLNAFGRNEPPDNYFKLAQRVVAYAQGLPSALNRIGSHLRKKSIDRWQVILDICDSCKGEPYYDIQTVLQKSCDDWDDVVQQVSCDMSYSDIRQLKEFKNLAKFTSMNFRGCKFLEKIPDLSGSPNLKHLVLSECKSLVEVDDSVGFLDKLVYLNLNGCSKLKRFATRLGLRSLEWLYLKGCTRLESFPEIEEGKMESLTDLDIRQSGIRELPSSIAYLSGLQRLKANECENFTGTSLHHLYGLQDLIQVHFGKCPKLVTFGNHMVKFDEVSSCNSITLALPNLFDLDLGGCNLSESDFLVPLGCWFALASLDLSRNNFVSLPDCISKFVNLMKLRLSGCKRLREIPKVLPPSLCDLYLNDCTSLEKIPRLPPMLELLELTNCFRLSGDEVAKLENNLLNEEPLQRDELQVILPSNEVQKWFRPSNYHAGHLISFDMSYSGIRQLKGFKNLAKYTSMNFKGCKFLEKIPDLSGSPNLKHLVLSECKSLVEVHDSVGFLDKLVYLNLNGCSKLKRFVTRLGLRSLEWLYLKGCTRLESFPEIEEGKMESLTDLDIRQSGIRELPSSIAYLSGLQRLKANECENLTGTSLHHLYGLQDLIQVHFGRCPKLVTFGKSKVKLDEVSSCSTQSQLLSTDLDISDCNSITLALPNLFDLDLGGCNLSESDFLVPLGCWFALASLDLSRNNFVGLPDCISKFVNLMKLRFSGCRRLQKIPQVLPPSLCDLYLDDCTSLEKIPKLPLMLERLELTNCIKLGDDEVAKLKNNWLNEESLQRAELKVILPDNEVQKWPSYTL
ncbi:disease resistance protein RUN1-like isoform X2 [Pyrus x bretschneideri]|uniref:disease resistance protein RUN1-like isoform X2 n=1 Tax=Pyrus x bretschneideri TaxID=225117 RepID=UPI00202F0AFB|nr:disease resistance protein RUN1-like isoform X2 [Pyrus x bretschneideri]